MSKSVLAALVAALLWAALGTGLAQGSAPAQDRLVICTGHGTTVLWIDADGEPVAQIVPCPDCILTWTGLASGPTWDVSRPEQLARDVMVVASVRGLRPKDLNRATARAPPEWGDDFALFQRT